MESGAPAEETGCPNIYIAFEKRPPPLEKGLGE